MRFLFWIALAGPLLGVEWPGRLPYGKPVTLEGGLSELRCGGQAVESLFDITGMAGFVVTAGAEQFAPARLAGNRWQVALPSLPAAASVTIRLRLNGRLREAAARSLVKAMERDPRFRRAQEAGGGGAAWVAALLAPGGVLREQYRALCPCSGFPETAAAALVERLQKEPILRWPGSWIDVLTSEAAIELVESAKIDLAVVTAELEKYAGLDAGVLAAPRLGEIQAATLVAIYPFGPVEFAEPRKWQRLSLNLGVSSFNGRQAYFYGAGFRLNRFFRVSVGALVYRRANETAFRQEFALMPSIDLSALPGLSSLFSRSSP